MSRIKSLYPQFQSWQQTSNIFIFSDPHFGDSIDRPLMGYPTEREQIKTLNKSIYGKHQTVICLGDVGDPTYMKWIPADKKILIKGNHDRGSSYYEPYFDEIYNGVVMIAPQIILSHESVIEPWALNIHGHTHGDKPYDVIGGVIYGINLAGDVSGFKALNLNDYVNNGGLSNIPTIHRLVIEKRR